MSYTLVYDYGLKALGGVGYLFPQVFVPTLCATVALCWIWYLPQPHIIDGINKYINNPFP